MKKIIILLAILILSLPLIADWELSFQVDAGREHTVTIGVNDTASQGYDRKIDRVSPPPPPEGFYTFLPINDPNAKYVSMLWNDIRAPGDAIVWRLLMKRVEEEGRIEWNPNSIPKEGILLLNGKNIRDYNAGQLQFNSVDSVVTIIYYRYGATETIEKAGIKLFKNNPNPFTAQTTIAFELPVDGHATIEIYDIFGHNITRLIDDDLQAGSHEVVWEGIDDNQKRMSNGIYFCNLTFDGQRLQQKVLLVDKDGDEKK